MKKNKDLSAVASAAAVLVLLLWVGTSVVVWRSPVEGAPQNPKRMLRRDHPSEGEPVVITKVTVEGNEVKFKKEFDAGNDWYKSLAITVENRSGKSLVYIDVGLLFRRPSDSTDPPAVFNMYYGGSESLALREGRPLDSGKSVELRFDQQDQAALEGFLSDTGYSSVPQIDVTVRTVLFGDGSEWSLGRWFSKDSKSPTGWSIKPKKQPVYLASARKDERKKYSHMEQCLRTEHSQGSCPDKQANPLISCGWYATDKESDPDPFASGGYDWLLCSTLSTCKDYLGHAIPGCVLTPRFIRRLVAANKNATQRAILTMDMSALMVTALTRAQS